MKTPVLPARFRPLARAAFLALLGLPLHAATVTWDNSNATNAWSTPANWDTNAEPSSADDVVLPGGLAATLTLSAGEQAKTLAINDHYTLTGGGLTLAGASTIGVLLGKARRSVRRSRSPAGRRRRAMERSRSRDRTPSPAASS